MTDIRLANFYKQIGKKAFESIMQIDSEATEELHGLLVKHWQDYPAKDCVSVKAYVQGLAKPLIEGVKGLKGDTPLTEELAKKLNIQWSYRLSRVEPFAKKLKLPWASVPSQRFNLRLEDGLIKAAAAGPSKETQELKELLKGKLKPGAEGHELMGEVQINPLIPPEQVLKENANLAFHLSKHFNLAAPTEFVGKLEEEVEIPRLRAGKERSSIAGHVVDILTGKGSGNTSIGPDELMGQVKSNWPKPPDPENPTFKIFESHLNDDREASLESLERALASDEEFKNQVVKSSGWKRNCPKGGTELLGLAFSGGGIRSATFNLGVLQALANSGLLPEFDYLSTVSGGGYIGSWLWGWIWRKPFDQVVRKLKPGNYNEMGKEPAEIGFLRSYSNYLTPQLGLFSADTWAFVATYVRNLLLNLTILVLGISAVLLVPRALITISNWLNIDVRELEKLENFKAPPFTNYFCFWYARYWPKLAIILWDKSTLLLALLFVSMAVAIYFSGLNMMLFEDTEERRKDGWPGYSRKLAIQCLVAFPVILSAWFTSCWLLNRGQALGWNWWSWWEWAIYGFAATLAVWLLGWLLYYLRNRKNEKRKSWKVLVICGSAAGTVGGLLLWILTTKVYSHFSTLPGRYVHVAAWGPALVSGIFGLMVALQIGLLGKDFPDERREWWSRGGALITILILGWTGLFALAVYSPLVLLWAGPWIGGTITLGWLAHTLTAVIIARGEKTAHSGITDGLGLFIKLAPVVFVVGLLALLSLGIYEVLPHQGGAGAEKKVSTISAVFNGKNDPKNKPAGKSGEDKKDNAANECKPACQPCAWCLPLGIPIVPKGILKDNTPRHDVLAPEKPESVHVDMSFKEGANGKSSEVTVTTKKEVSYHDRAFNYWPSIWCKSGGSIGLACPDDKNKRPLPLSGILVGILLCGGFALLLSMRVDVNEFSMHLLYRNRLVRCYLGASHEGEKCERNPNPFTGFDPEDDFLLAKLAQESGSRYAGPYPIINATLNLTHGKRLAWQERKAKSFIFTPRFCGFEVEPDSCGPVADMGKPMPIEACGFRPTGDYMYPGDGPFVGTAMAISGAAASPNMGYISSPALAFLMTVFDVRLGWWAGNPRHKTTWKERGPKLGIMYLLLELFGSTNDERGYVYLSDGGHFENLGVYELVRRRCPYIVVSDASADPELKFEDLGNAIRKCRVDFGVEIDIDVGQIRRDLTTNHSLAHCAVGVIKYPGGAESGTLVYLKPSLVGDETADVLEYASLHPQFPHQTTADQWFDESQFESYRELGYHITKTAFNPATSYAQNLISGRKYFFEVLKDSWCPTSTAIKENFTRHAEEYNDIMERARKDPTLGFLDAELFPESKPPLDPSKSGYAGRRNAFYICNSLIQLMEDVYIDLNLEIESQHPSNKGWMETFRQWSESPAFIDAWIGTSTTFGAPFRRFCDRNFRLPFINDEGQLPSGGSFELMPSRGATEIQIQPGKSEVVELAIISLKGFEGEINLASLGRESDGVTCQVFPQSVQLPRAGRFSVKLTITVSPNTPKKKYAVLAGASSQGLTRWCLITVTVA